MLKVSSSGWAEGCSVGLPGEEIVESPGHQGVMVSSLVAHAAHSAVDVQLRRGHLRARRVLTAYRIAVHVGVSASGCKRIGAP